MIDPRFAAYFWGFLLLYGGAMYVLSPQSKSVTSFKATTLSGTMVMGLAPVFLPAPLVRYSPWSFHLAFWPGIIIGLTLAASAIPPSWAIGSGKYALLLGANVYGLMICVAGFLLPLLWQGTRNSSTSACATPQ